jgi:streptogramin lyase
VAAESSQLSWVESLNRVRDVAAITADGVQYAVDDAFPGAPFGSIPLGITTGYDGNLWLTESASYKIGKFVP